MRSASYVSALIFAATLGACSSAPTGSRQIAAEAFYLNEAEKCGLHHMSDAHVVAFSEAGKKEFEGRLSQSVGTPTGFIRKVEIGQGAAADLLFVFERVDGKSGEPDMFSFRFEKFGPSLKLRKEVKDLNEKHGCSGMAKVDQTKFDSFFR